MHGVYTRIRVQSDREIRVRVWSSGEAVRMIEWRRCFGHVAPARRIFVKLFFRSFFSLLFLFFFFLYFVDVVFRRPEKLDVPHKDLYILETRQGRGVYFRDTSRALYFCTRVFHGSEYRRLQKRSKKLETKRSFFKLKWDLCRISSTVLITRTIYVVPMISRAPNHNTLPLQRFHPYLVGMRFHGLFNDARSARLCSQ